MKGREFSRGTTLVGYAHLSPVTAGTV